MFSKLLKLNPFSVKRFKRFSVLKKNRLGIAASSILLMTIFYGLFFYSPASFSRSYLFSVEKGATVGQTARGLEERKILSSVFLFKVFVKLFGSDAGVLAGNYYFSREIGVVPIAWRLTHGVLGQKPIRVTIPEGTSSLEMAKYFQKFERFDPEEFQKIAEQKEGYLFPDTYLFTPSATAEEVVTAMENNFWQKVGPIRDGLAEDQGFQEILVMASILEEEARKYETKQKISGILWKRIEMGMPLQVDAVFPYIIGKGTFDLTLEDLGYDSPYNTYKYKGLPPGPITNPGLDSIRAAMNPSDSKYLFFLTGNDGRMHYAISYDDHVQNKRLYLR